MKLPRFPFYEKLAHISWEVITLRSRVDRNGCASGKYAVRRLWLVAERWGSVGIFDAFKKKPESRKEPLPEQAVLIALDGTGLPDSVYESYDLSTLETQIVNAIEGTGLGEFDGNEIGPQGASLYLYGPDAEKLYERIERILKQYPLCQSALVTIRTGPPGAPQHQVTIR
jgi:hypothetical protein